MDATDYFHALTVTWYYQPYLQDPSTHTSEVHGNVAVLRDRHGKTLAIVDMVTENVIIDRNHLRQFDMQFP
jgi:hypothetical protein